MINIGNTISWQVVFRAVFSDWTVYFSWKLAVFMKTGGFQWYKFGCLPLCWLKDLDKLIDLYRISWGFFFFKISHWKPLVFTKKLLIFMKSAGFQENCQFSVKTTKWKLVFSWKLAIFMKSARSRRKHTQTQVFPVFTENWLVIFSEN